MIELTARIDTSSRETYATRLSVHVQQQSIFGRIWMFAAAYMVEVGMLLSLASAVTALEQTSSEKIVSLAQRAQELDARGSWNKIQLDAILLDDANTSRAIESSLQTFPYA